MTEAMEERGYSTAYSSPGADEEVFTLISQETIDSSQTTHPLDDEKVTAVEPEISFSLWAAIAAVLGFGFGGLLALRARAKSKAEKAEKDM